jgi:hypothetical protein
MHSQFEVIPTFLDPVLSARFLQNPTFGDLVTLDANDAI